MDAPRPDFEDPPVVEVALSVQFDSLPNLHMTHLGLLWERFRDRFPVVEEQSPLEPVFERFGGPRIRRGSARIEMLKSLPIPRCWFLNEAGTELVQVQHDRFIHNWREADTDARYPRYEHIRSGFESELQQFSEFVAEEELGDFAPRQCEVTYVNHIAIGGNWQTHGDLGQVLTVFQAEFNDSFLETVEDAGLRLRFVIPNKEGEPIGRLHAALEPGYRTDDRRPMFVLELTARGAPLGEGITGVLAFLDLGREWVVRGFTSMTTPVMHKEWGRKDVT